MGSMKNDMSFKHLALLSPSVLEKYLQLQIQKNTQKISLSLSLAKTSKNHPSPETLRLRTNRGRRKWADRKEKQLLTEASLALPVAGN
jgi:hypothetical protein